MPTPDTAASTMQEHEAAATETGVEASTADDPQNDVTTAHTPTNRGSSMSMRSASGNQARRTPRSRAEQTGSPRVTAAKFRRTPDPALHRQYSSESGESSQPVLITEERQPHPVFPGEDDQRSRSMLSDDVTIYDDDASDGGIVDRVGETDSNLDGYRSAGIEGEGEGEECYDTDLEVDDEDWMRGEDKFDLTGIESYVRECNRLGVIPVSYFQRHIEEKRFVMRNHGLGPLGAKAIAKPLESNTHIETIDLEGNFIQSEGALYLGRMLRENLFITELVLSENRLTGIGAQAICTALLENTTVTKLDLSGNCMRDADGEMFHLLLQHNAILRALILRNNNFATATAKCMKEALSDNESLRILDLSWNNFRKKDGIIIAEGIQENYGLKQLNIAMNGLAVEGAIAMGHALLHNQCLEELDLSNNRISDAGAVGVAKGLAANETLIALKLENNTIHFDGSLAIIQALEKNQSSTLKYLNLLATIVPQTFEVIRVRLKKERNLEIFCTGVSTKSGIVFTDSLNAEAMYNKDPMTKIRKWADQEGLRLVDIFQKFDTDKSWTVDREEFIMGIRSTGLQISDAEIDLMLEKLDTDENGEIDYRALAEGDRQNREEKERLAALRRKQEEEEAAAAWQAAMESSQQED